MRSRAGGYRCRATLYIRTVYGESSLHRVSSIGERQRPRPPKVSKIMAQSLYRTIILHTFGVQGETKIDRHCCYRNGWRSGIQV